MTWLYDNILLYAAFKVYFAGRIWIWMPVLLFLILLTPVHRRSTRIIVGALAAWHLACCLLWDMYAHAPLAAWVIGGALLYRISLFIWFLVPHGWFSTRLVRLYLRFDPSCVYLFDLARARRRLPLVRTPEERRSQFPEPFDLSRAQLRLMAAAARILEWAIWLSQRLPRYWTVPHRKADFDQPHVRSVLQADVDRSYAAFHQNFLAITLALYEATPPDDNHKRDALARRYAERYARLHDAFAEYLTFVRPLPAGHADSKWEAYRLLLRAWRFRREYDWLWYGREDESPEAAPGGIATPTEDAAGLSPEAAESESDVERESAPIEDEPAATSTAEEDSELGLAPEPADAAGSSTVRTAADPKEAGPAQSPPPPPAPERVPIEPEPTAEVSPVEPEGPESSGLTDEELFRSVTQEAEAVESPAVEKHVHDLAGDLADPRHAARNQRLVDACRILEILLGLGTPETIGDAAARTRLKLQDPKLWQPAFHLLVMYCARLDWSGEEADRLKRQILEHLANDLAAKLAGLRRSRRVNGLSFHAVAPARLVLADLLVSRHEFASVRGMYAGAAHITAREHELLGKACVGLANQIGSHEELRGMLRYEAIDHLFQAGFRRIWGLGTIRELMGEISSQAKVVELLQRYPVALVEGSTS